MKITVSANSTSVSEYNIIFDARLSLIDHCCGKHDAPSLVSICLRLHRVQFKIWIILNWHSSRFNFATLFNYHSICLPPTGWFLIDAVLPITHCALAIIRGHFLDVENWKISKICMKCIWNFIYCDDHSSLSRKIAYVTDIDFILGIDSSTSFIKAHF